MVDENCREKHKLSSRDIEITLATWSNKRLHERRTYIPRRSLAIPARREPRVDATKAFTSKRGTWSIGRSRDRSHRSQWERRERRFVHSTRGKQMAKYLHLSRPLRRYRVGRVFRTRGASEEDGILRRAEKGRTGKSRQGKKGWKRKVKKIWEKRKVVDDEQVGRDWTRVLRRIRSNGGERLEGKRRANRRSNDEVGV